MIKRLKQFYRAITAKITDADKVWLAEKLSPAAQELFYAMHEADQYHAINVAKTADFKYVVSTSPKHALSGSKNKIPRQIAVIYNEHTIISAIISLLIIFSCRGIGRSFLYYFSAGSLP